MRSKKLSPAIFFAGCILLFTICGSLLFLLPQHTYSENENRYLTTLKKPTVSGFLDTSMQKNFTDGSNDQFIGRDLWMKFATALQHSIGFQDIGGVYLGKNGYYFERILNSQLSETRYLNNLQMLEQFAQTYQTNLYFLPVPSKGTILKKQLPDHAVLYQEDKLYTQAAEQLHNSELIDIRSLLTDIEDKVALYFKTDHHWTMHAAYLAYTAWCQMQEQTPKPISQFSPKCASDKFFGTLYSKAPDFQVQPDQLYLPFHVPEAKIIIDETQTNSIYDWNKLDTKDKYGVYFGGNFGRIDIYTKSSSDNKTLLVIKDSFANSFIPFIMADYAHIVMIDFRYYNMPYSSLMNEIQPDDTLVLYEISNFAQDTNFLKILK